MFNLKSHFKENKGLFIALTALFVATVLISGFMVYTLVSLRTFIRNGSQDMVTVTRLQKFMLDLQQAESSQRGFIISGDNNSYKSYSTAAEAVPRDMAELKSDPVMRVGYAAQTAELETRSAQRLRQLVYTLDIYATQGREAALQVRFEQGRETMDGIRRTTDSIITAEFAKVAPQQRSSSENLERSLILGPLLALIVLALCLVIGRYFQKAIEKERAIEGSKNEFLSLASHQLRTPATNVKQYVHLVLDGYFGPLNAEQKQALETASRNNDIEISIVNDLLDVAKADLNQIIVTPQPANVGRLVRQVMRDFRGPAKKRGQRLTYREPRGTPKAMVDPTYFKTVVENLIDNASKYSPPHSPIMIEGKEERGRFVLSVTDKGVGIPRQHQHKLFKKFSRIPNALSNAVEGSGLGLYWVKRVVELHAGRINVESKANAGTTFTVSLPLAPVPKKQASHAPLSPARPA